MTKYRVVVKIEFGVQCVELTFLGEQKWIDLRKRSIEIDVRTIKRGHELDRVVHSFLWKSDPKRKLAGLKRLEPNCRIDRFLENLLWLFCRDLLNIHAARRGSHKHQLRDRAIQHDAEIKLLLYVQPLLDQHRTNFAALGSGLMSD